MVLLTELYESLQINRAGLLPTVSLRIQLSYSMQRTQQVASSRLNASQRNRTLNESQTEDAHKPRTLPTTQACQAKPSLTLLACWATDRDSHIHHQIKSMRMGMGSWRASV